MFSPWSRSVHAGVVTSVTAAQAEVVSNERASYWRRVRALRERRRGRAPDRQDRGAQPDHLDRQRQRRSSQFQFQPHGNLVGRITGDTYQLTGVTRGTYNDILQSGESTLTYVNSYQLIGPGPGNNLLVREIAHLTIDGDDVVVHHDDFSIECN